MAIAFAIGIGLVMILAVFVSVLIGSPDKGKQIARRLEGTAPELGSSIEEAAHEALIRDEQLSTLPWLNRALLGWSRIDHVRAMIAQAGMETKPGQILLSSAVGAFAGYLFVHIFFGGYALAMIAAIVLGLAPIGTVYFKRMRRMNNFEKNFAEAIDLLARAVRSGHSLNTGMEIVGQEMAEPIAGEFRKTFEEQHLGLQFREALINLTHRVPLQDVRFFAAALIIQEETGGNLAEILGNLSATIRERFKIRGEVKVKTAQGRMTAAILICLPPAMLALLFFVNPEYISTLFTDAIGMYILIGAVIMQVIGTLFIWKIVSIEV